MNFCTNLVNKPVNDFMGLFLFMGKAIKSIDFNC